MSPSLEFFLNGPIRLAAKWGVPAIRSRRCAGHCSEANLSAPVALVSLDSLLRVRTRLQNVLLTTAPGMEILDADTGAQDLRLRVLETGTDAQNTKSPRFSEISTTQLACLLWTNR